MRAALESKVSVEVTHEAAGTEPAASNGLSEKELVSRVIEWIKQNHRAQGNGEPQITADTELVTSGLLDSLGLVDLIHFIETQVGCRTDLMDVDPEEFTVVKGLCRIALRSQDGSRDALRQ